MITTDADPSAADRPPAWHWLHTLKFRIAVAALLAVLGGIALVLWHLDRIAEHNLLRLEEVRSQEEVARMAGVVGHRVAELQRALRLAASQVRRESLDQPGQLMAHYTGHVVLRGLFASLGVADAGGTVRFVVESAGPRETAVHIGDRDYFRRAVQTRMPAISAPIPSRVTQVPIIVFAHPLVDDLGVWGVLVGTLHLNARDLIDDLAETRNYDDSTLVAITDDAGVLIAHPQSARLLAPLSSEPRLAEAARRWHDEGRPIQHEAGRWSSADDVVAMAGEPATGWRVWRVTDRARLLAPLRAASRDAMAVALAFAATMALMLLAYVVAQMQPLTRLQALAEGLLRGEQDPQWPQARGEIGVLIRTLQHVWAERQQVERFNAQVLQRLTSVMAASPVGLAFSRHQRFELVSAECCRLLGCSERDLLGNPMAMIFAAPTDYPEMRRAARAAFETGQAYEGEWRLRSAQGRDFWARVRARPVVEGDADSGAIWSLYDIGDQVTARESLLHEALHDGLTGLMNRKGLMRRLGEAWQRRDPDQPDTLVMIDLDHFKPVNDRGGHAAGDAMLVAVAGAVSRQVRGTDTVARIGGDEFAVLLPNCRQAHAAEIAAKILQGIRDIELDWPGLTLRVGASIGVAEASPLHGGIDAWIAAADAACYAAKADGRNAVRLAPDRGAIRLVTTTA